MKRIIILLSVFLVAILFYGCTSASKAPDVPDDIVHNTIGKTMIGIGKDSVNVSCYPVVFEIYRNPDTTSNDSLLVQITRNIPAAPNNCTRTFMDNASLGQAIALHQNDLISESGVWGSSNGIWSLDDFRGNGDRYLGLVTETVAGNVLYRNFAWICVRISINNDTLRIIDWAYNNTAYKSIKAGQKE
jgi:hypothetical protein